MATTTMHFGPEWMRTKLQPSSRNQPPPSPPPAVNVSSGASTYSALVSPASAPQVEKRDESHPFRYSKEELLRIYKEGGGRGGLGLEVERWEGVVREVGSEPIALREMSEAEKKLFAGPLNSELRRRQSTDLISSHTTTSLGGERPRLNHNNPATGSPLRERFGSFMRRRDSTDQSPLTTPRKLSLSSGPALISSPRESSQPSPRPRVGFSPSFDGVLNGGESWIVRRRTSEGLLRAGSARGDAGSGEVQQDGKESEIKEEEEEAGEGEKHGSEGKTGEQEETLEVYQLNPSPQPSPSRSVHSYGSPKNLPEPQVSTTDSFASNETCSSSSNGTDPAGVAITRVRIPQSTIPDLSSVEWSYLDPQGQVQGPFRADLMQKWHDEGYFSPDLLMKRTNVDTEWIPVGELGRHSGGKKIFLSQQIASVPPGLSRPSDSPPQSFAPPADQGALNEPYQPAPVRSLRTSTLDSYLTSSSNPSDSPTSSFGGGRFGNGSPDTASLGLSAGNHYSTSDSPMGARIATFSASSDPAVFSNVRRNTYHDPSLDPSLAIRTSFGNIAPGRASSIDSYGFNSPYNSAPQPAWQQSSSNPVGSSFDGIPTGRGDTEVSPFPSNFPPCSSAGPSLAPQIGYGGAHGLDAPYADNGSGSFSASEYAMGDFGNQLDPQFVTRSAGDGEVALKPGFNNYANGPFENSNQGQQYTVSLSLQYPTLPPPPPSPPLQQQQPLQLLPSRFGQQGTNSNAGIPNSHPTASATAPRSSWHPQEPPTVRRPGPFDPLHPTSTNTTLNEPPIPPQSSSWNRPNQTSQPASLPNESPWFIASQGVVDQNWKEVPGPNSLTFRNVGQHNQLQQELAAPNDHSNIQESDQLPAAESPIVAPIVVPVAAPVKSRRKSTTHLSQSQVPASKPSPAPAPIVKSPSPPPSSQAKPAWLNEDDTKKAKPASVSPSLRDIQEAETKKNEARKAAERERDRVVRAAAAPPAVVEDPQPFTASWGLPTSQAGAARNTASQKETPAASSNMASSTSAVWTNTGKVQPSKKSMKEIQEEEERRKKYAVKETVAATAARRVYSETMNKPASAAPTSSAWTTVGASGKAPVMIITPTRAPSSSTLNASGSPTASRTNGMAPPRSPAGSSVVKASPPTPKVEDPVSPSHEFLKWLSDSLKVLNNSVNVEEIISMLLSFPMDPDQSTIEIISDLIYANSTTLDGRRFASEFVSRRKADAASRHQSGGAHGGTAKPVSIADVVKAQPKPMQPEWGFKVVNKKKKGGRA